MKTHKDLDVYNLSITVVIELYNTTKNFPKEDLFGITSQIRRAAASIPTNIAEGSARNHSKEFKQFLYIALGSPSELDTLILIVYELGYITQDRYNFIILKLASISKMLQGLIKSIKSNNN